MPLGIFPPRKFPPGIFPPMFWNIPAWVFYSFSSLLSPLSLILLKGLFCVLSFKSAEVFTFVKICQNNLLNEERKWVKWVEIFQARIFWVAIFRGGSFPRGSLMGGNVFGGNSPGGIFFVMYLYLLFFQKIINKYKKTFNKKIYAFFKFIKCRAKFLSRNFLFQWAQNVFNWEYFKQWKFWVVSKREIRGKCKS